MPFQGPSNHPKLFLLCLLCIVQILVPLQAEHGEEATQDVNKEGDLN